MQTPHMINLLSWPETPIHSAKHDLAFPQWMQSLSLMPLCILIILVDLAKVLSLELLELFLCEDRLWLFDCLLRLVLFIPGLPP